MATAGSVLGIANGLQRGGATGNIQAAAGAAGLANRAGYFGGAPNAAVGQGLGALGGAMGLYNGLQQGGVQGYGNAAVGAMGLGANAAAMSGNMAMASSLGSAAGAVAIPLALYSEIKNWQSGATGADAMGGAATGAAVGTMVMPGIGTAVGALIGGAAGALSSAFGPGRVDPENTNFNQSVDLYKKYGDAGVNAIGDKYTALAGLFDLRSGQIGGNIPIYKQYGRMGEQQFTTDMTKQLDNALQSGAITKSTDPQTAYNKVVQPWIDSFGKGSMSDVNQGSINSLLKGMVGDYLTSGTSTWKAIGGDNPFQSSSVGNMRAVGGGYSGGHSSTNRR